VERFWEIRFTRTQTVLIWASNVLDPDRWVFAYTAVPRGRLGEITRCFKLIAPSLSKHPPGYMARSCHHLHFQALLPAQLFTPKQALRLLARSTQPHALRTGRGTVGDLHIAATRSR